MRIMETSMTFFDILFTTPIPGLIVGVVLLSPLTAFLIYVAYIMRDKKR